MLDANLSIYEHQSTLCPNMPLRSMIYFSQIIREMVRNKNIYGSTQVKIPVPYFVVFYNGVEQAPEQYELRLSDAFERQVDHPQMNSSVKSTTSTPGIMRLSWKNARHYGSIHILWNLSEKTSSKTDMKN